MPHPIFGWTGRKVFRCCNTCDAMWSNLVHTARSKNRTNLSTNSNCFSIIWSTSSSNFCCGIWSFRWSKINHRSSFIWILISCYRWWGCWRSLFLGDRLGLACPSYLCPEVQGWQTEMSLSRRLLVEDSFHYQCSVLCSRHLPWAQLQLLPSYDVIHHIPFRQIAPISPSTWADSQPTS